MFELTHQIITPNTLRTQHFNTHTGAQVTFEGIVRMDKHAGKEVTSLLYIADEPSCMFEGKKIITEATEQFSLTNAVCVQRIGMVPAGESAIWIGTLSTHRDEAFQGCRYIIEEIKKRLLIWKKEYFTDQTSQWVRSPNSIVNVC